VKFLSYSHIIYIFKCTVYLFIGFISNVLYILEIKNSHLMIWVISELWPAWCRCSTILDTDYYLF